MSLPAVQQNYLDVRLEGQLTMECIGQMQSTLLTALNSGADINLDLDPESPCDLALIQVLCAAHLSAQRRGQRIQLIVPLPPAANELLQRVGFAGECSCGRYSDHGCLLTGALK